MTFRRHAVAAVLALTQTIHAKDPRELTLELLSSRESWSGMKMASRSGARYECSAGEARRASQVTQKKTEDHVTRKNLRLGESSPQRLLGILGSVARCPLTQTF